MKKIDFTKAQFLRSVVEEEHYPRLFAGKHNIPEIALVGKSNVGKSSLINHLTQNKSLAKTSSVPGKTQTLNFYLLDDKVCLVDLPGYGYSKVSKTTKKLWADSLESYLLKREQLILILMVIDLRRELSPEDAEFITWASLNQKPLFFIFSKSDKLLEQEKQLSVSMLSQQIQSYYPNHPVEFVEYSIKDTLCRKILRDQILTFIQK